MDNHIDNNIYQIDVTEKIIESNNEEKELKIEFTLDESIKETLKRDFTRIWHKLFYVIIPRSKVKNNVELRNWDLWGPLIFTVILSILISFADHASPNVFITIFVFTFFGSGIVTINGILLGASITFLQTVSILGYCLFPIVLCAGIIHILKAANVVSYVNVIIACIGFLWASFSSIAFFSQLNTYNKKFLLGFPLFIYYLTLSWFLLSIQELK